MVIEGRFPKKGSQSHGKQTGGMARSDQRQISSLETGISKPIFVSDAGFTTLAGLNEILSEMLIRLYSTAVLWPVYQGS